MRKTVTGNQMIHQWYAENIHELSRHFITIEFDDLAFTWVLIHDYPLPKTFYQNSSPVLIGTPGMNIENHVGYSFFMDLQLSRLDGKQAQHLIDYEGYNPYKNLGYCKLSYHLQAFNPTYPIDQGDTLFDICQSLFHFLGKRW